MIPISSDLLSELNSESQIVTPTVKAWMADMRYLENVKTYTSSHSYSKQTLDLNPQLYYKFDKMELDVYEENKTFIVSIATPAVVTLTSHGLAAGTALTLKTTGSLPTGLTASNSASETLYYVQNPTTNTFNLNTNQANAIANSATGRVATSGTQSGIHTLNYNTNGGNRIKNYGNNKISLAMGESTSGVPVYNSLLATVMNNFKFSDSVIEVLDSKRIIDTFNRSDSQFLGSCTSSDASDYDMSLYSFNSNSTLWQIYSNQAYYRLDTINDNTKAIYQNVQGLDHFVDFKVGATFKSPTTANSYGIAAYVRYIDENNFISATQTAATTILIQKRINGDLLTLNTITGSFSSSNYYRLEMKYNSIALYNMGTSEPTNSTTPVSTLGTAFVNNPIFRTNEAKNVGLGFYRADIYNATTYAEVYFDYFAAYGFNYIIGMEVLNGAKYNYSSTALDGNTSTQFNAINNCANFTYNFLFNKTNTGSGTQTIFWLGDSLQKTAIQISYIMSTNKIRVTVVDKTTLAATTLTSSATLSAGTNYQISVIKNGLTLSLYINGIFDNSAALSSGFILRDVTTSLTPYFTIGADYAGTTLGDASGYHFCYGYISEFSMFDYALAVDDLLAMYTFISNAGTLAVDTIDKYSSATRAIDGVQEETFAYAFTNFLNKNNHVIKSNNYCYVPDSTGSIEKNYSWMTRVKSNSSTGIFANQDFIKIKFDAQNCNRIKVSTGFYLGAISSFNFSVQKADTTVVTGTKSFAGQSYVFLELTDLGLAAGEYISITSIKITPVSTVNPGDFGRIYTINPIWEVDLSDYVISFNVDKVRENYDASLPLGATAANNGSLTLSNTDLTFNLYGDSIYKDYLFPDTVIFIYLNHYIEKTGTFETIPVGYEMYVDDWSIDDSSMKIDVKFRDYSKFLQEETIAGYVSQGLSAGRSISDILLKSGFPRRKIYFNDKYRESIFLDDPSIYFPFDKNLDTSYVYDLRSTTTATIQTGFQTFYLTYSDIANFNALTVGNSVTIYYIDNVLKYMTGTITSKGTSPSPYIGVNVTSSIGSGQLSNWGIITNTYKKVYDQSSSVYGLAVSHSNDESASGLLYSDALSVQDDAQRQVDDFAIQTFTPEYIDSSYRTIYPIYLYNKNDNSNFIFANNNNFTTEIMHYVKDVTTLATSTDYSILTCARTSGIYNYDLRYQIIGTKIRYEFGLWLTSPPLFKITSGLYDCTSPHHLVVTKKTVGAVVTYEFFVDGVSVGSQDIPSALYAITDNKTYFETDMSTYISNFSYYDYALSNDRIKSHYIAASLSIVPTFKYIYTSDSSYWDSMLEIATADLGMFYFDEYGYFRYEYRNVLHDIIFDRYQNSQYNFSDSTNIISGSYTSDVQTNKVTVKINKSTFDANSTTPLWSSEQGESLAVTSITSDVTPASTSIPLANVDNPIWTLSGYVKIDNEIIKYDGINGKNLVKLTRGCFNTEIAWHIFGARARELRYYEAKYADSPAVVVNYPFVTQEITENLVDIDYYVSDSFSTKIAVSLKDPGVAAYSNNGVNYFYARGDYYTNIIFLEGKDPLTQSDNFFRISGVAVKNDTAKEVLTNITSEITDNIRKYRLKEIQIDNKFIANKFYAQLVSDYIIGYYKNPIKIFKINTIGVPHLQLGDCVTITNFTDFGMTNQKFWIMNISISYDGGISQSLDLKTFSESIDAPEVKYGSAIASPQSSTISISQYTTGP
jgi:hypothetical protein